MKLLTSLTTLLLVSTPAASLAKTEQAIANAIAVDNGPVHLTLGQFNPIKTHWAGREVVTGYKAFVEVNNDMQVNTLLFQGNAEISANWFAANFMADVYVSCSDVPMGYDLAQGRRAQNISTPADVAITELRHGVADCQQLKVEVQKRGNVSRQFFTRFERLDFVMSLESIKEAK